MATDDNAADALYGAATAPSQTPAAQQPGRAGVDTEAAAQALYAPKTPAVRKPAARADHRESDDEAANPLDRASITDLYPESKKPDLDEHGYIKRPDDKDSTDEPKAGESTKAGGDAKDAEDDGEKKAEEGAPESYDLKMPDGWETDQEALDDFAPVAKELELSNEQAQKLADVHTRILQRQTEAHQKMIAQWGRETRAKCGSDEIQDGRDFLKSLNDPEVGRMLIWSGLGNHPSIVKMFAAAGRAQRELRNHRENYFPLAGGDD